MFVFFRAISIGRAFNGKQSILSFFLSFFPSYRSSLSQGIFSLSSNEDSLIKQTNPPVLSCYHFQVERSSIPNGRRRKDSSWKEAIEIHPIEGDSTNRDYLRSPKGKCPCKRIPVSNPSELLSGLTATGLRDNTFVLIFLL